MGSKKTKTTTNQTTTPQVPSWIQDPQKAYAGRLGGLTSGDPSAWASTFTPATAQQQQAFNYTGQAGSDALKGLLGGGISSDLTGYQNGQIGTIAGTDLSQYTNPYENMVVQSALNDNDRARQMAIQQGQAQATASGAFGGSRHGVADSLTNQDYLRNAGTMASNLRSQGFQNAQGLAQQDIGNRASQEGLNLNSAQMRLAAQQGLFGQKLSAAGAYADNDARNAGMMADLGEQQRQLNARANPNSIESLQAMGGLIGYNPAMYVGQNQQGTSTTKESGGQLGQVLGGLGSLAMGLGTGGLGFGALGGAGLGAASGFTKGWGSGLSRGLMGP